MKIFMLLCMTFVMSCSAPDRRSPPVPPVVVFGAGAAAPALQLPPENPGAVIPPAPLAPPPAARIARVPR